MRRRTNGWWAIGVGLLLASAGGCGKSPAHADVSGMVTFEGKPLPGVVVTFYPIVEKGEPRLAFSRATTDSTGSYTLTCEDGKPGALVGKHRVVVNWPQRTGREMATRPAPAPAIPEPYTLASDTPLQEEVKEGANTIPLDLKRQ